TEGRTPGSHPTNGNAHPHHSLGEAQRATLAELVQLLSQSDGSSSKGDESSDSKEVVDLAHALFGRAHEEFLSRKSSETLMNITRALAREVRNFLSGEDRFRVKVEAGEDSLSLYAVLGDRPFIVNSLRECVLYHNCTIDVFLHPIILRQGQRLS